MNVELHYNFVYSKETRYEPASCDDDIKEYQVETEEELEDLENEIYEEHCNEYYEIYVDGKLYHKHEYEEPTREEKMEFWE